MCVSLGFFSGQVTLLVAAMYTAVGALRLGFLTNFLSHSVLSGFTTGAAAVIGISQVCPPIAPAAQVQKAYARALRKFFL